VLSVSSLNAKNGNYGSVPNTLTTNTYDWYDGAVQATITHKPNTSQSTQYLTTFYHNDAGQLTRAHVGDYYAQNVTFTNDENGRSSAVMKAHPQTPPARRIRAAA